MLVLDWASSVAGLVKASSSHLVTWAVQSCEAGPGAETSVILEATCSFTSIMEG